MKKTVTVFLTFAILLSVCLMSAISADASGLESRHILANWDDPDKSPSAPAGAEIKAPYEGYEFGNALITGLKTIGITPNAAAAGDDMLALYIKVPTPVTPGSAHWTTFLFYSADYNRPQGIRQGVPVYYIPSENNGTDMSIYTEEGDGIYSKNTENHDVRIEYGYEGWVIINLSDITVDWWNGYVEMEAISADKIKALDIVAGITDGTVIDEIQTFSGTLQQFREECGSEEEITGLDRNMIADWDYVPFSPNPPEGTAAELPYDGYRFGNALITGIKTIGLTPNLTASGDNMLAMYIKAPTPVTPGSAHWTTFLFYSADYNRPQGIQSGAPVYYIPAEENGADMSIYTIAGNGIYSKNTENNDVRIEYGYEGWIIIDLNTVTVDWWNGKAEMEPLAADKITVLDIVAGIADGTVIDEIQSFYGNAGQFAAVCDQKLNVVENRADRIGDNGIGDFNSDNTVDLKDVISLKKKISVGARWNADNDIYVDGAYNSVDLIALKAYLLS